MAAPGPTQGAAPEVPQLIYSPWAKFCGKGNDPGAREVCFTGKDARTEAGQPVVAAALIEPEGEPKKLFRVTLPSPLQLQYGARIVIDKEPPISSAFFTCFANGCMADYEATPELVDKLKKGRMLQIQAINLAAAAITFPLPLADNSGNTFQKANEGAPTDPKVVRGAAEEAARGLAATRLTEGRFSAARQTGKRHRQSAARWATSSAVGRDAGNECRPPVRNRVE